MDVSNIAIKRRAAISAIREKYDKIRRNYIEARAPEEMRRE